MNSSEKVFLEIDELIELAIEGSISPEQNRLLNDRVVSDSAICRHYCEYIQLTVGIERLSVHLPTPGLPEYDMVFDKELWSQLAREEETALRIEATDKQPKPELIQKVIYPPREKRKVSKFNIVFVLLNTAAMFLLVLFLRFSPPLGGIEVATLSHSINAKWACAAQPVENGARIVTGSDSLLLQEGYVELLFDNHARITLEGPAEFQILAEDRIGLNYGKIYATIPTEAVGFSIYTQNTKIIDLGTEFGVQADSAGETELHVFKGKVQLLIQKGNPDGRETTVSVGQAKRIDHTGRVSVISEKPEKFVRSIRSPLTVIADFEGLTGDTLLSGWTLIDHNGTAVGPTYTNLLNSGPSGVGDTCGRIGPADGSLEKGPHNTPGGWIQCLKTFDSSKGFYGGFDFYMDNTSQSPDAQFLFGEISEDAQDYYYTAISRSEGLNEVFTVKEGVRKLLMKPTVVSNLDPNTWYHFDFRFVPVHGTTGHFTYQVTNLAGNKTYVAVNPIEITLPDRLTFGFGNFDDTSCFDNIKIIPLSE